MARYALVGATALLVALTGSTARAGVTNPQISIIGQPLATWTGAPDDPNRDRVRLDPGETEIVFDDYLNPYARGYFTLALGEEGLELEEGYFTLFRGLPFDVAVRGGKFRVPFGRLNPNHPHTYPFAEPFEVLAAYLPGEEAFNETGVDLSRRLPIAGDFSLNAQVEYLQGDSFRLEREPAVDDGDPLNQGGDDNAGQTRPAFFGRLSGFTMLGERSAIELGFSAAGGTGNVAAGARTRVFGADAKAKLWRSPRAYLLVQAEALRLEREEALWSDPEGYTVSTVESTGGYLFADYNFDTRYNVGTSVESFQEPTREKPWTRGYGLFAGYALMEETTALRLDWKRIDPEGGDAFSTVTLRVIYSMGPHKAHQF